MSIASTIETYVSRQRHGKVFTVDWIVSAKHLSETERPAAVRALSRQVKEGKLVRIANGTYYRPKVSRFGRLPVETEELVKVVSRSKKAAVVPAGAAAVNALGLDTQLPMVRSYFISERVRSDFKNVNVKFEYKESLQYFSEHFKVKDKHERDCAMLFWSAISYMDKSGIGHYQEKLTEKFHTILAVKTQEKFLIALSPSMSWANDYLNSEITN